MSPEDYGALYAQWATALHAVDPGLHLGGPVSAVEDPVFWANASHNTSWLNRFLNSLSAHSRLDDLAFFALEHYPFNPCGLQRRALFSEPATIASLFAWWAATAIVGIRTMPTVFRIRTVHQ